MGLTHHGFLKLRDKYFEWQENTHAQDKDSMIENENENENNDSNEIDNDKNSNR